MKYLTSILYVLVLYCEDVNTSNFTVDTQVYFEDVNTINFTTSAQAFDNKINCTLAFEDDKSGKKKMNSMVKVVLIITKFSNGTEQILSRDFKKSEIFKPLEWMRVSGKYGKGILQLKPNYEILSLQSLTIQMEETELKLTETPSGCMSQLSATEYEEKMRTFLLKYTSKGRHGEICNIHIGDHFGKAVFYYECCSTDNHEEMECHRVRKNGWVKLIDILTCICIILFIMYFPALIPQSVYSKTAPLSAFVHVLEKPFTKLVNKEEFSKTKEKKFFQKPKNEKKEDKAEHKFEKLYLKIESDQLVSENSSPISLTRILYEAIKPKDNYSLHSKEGQRNKKHKLDFLKANILGPIKLCGKQLKWGTFIHNISQLILSVLVISPWIFRTVVYYFYEKEFRLRRQRAAEDRNLGEHFGGNLTYFFGPVHGLFLICYALVCVDLILFGMLRREVKKMFEQTLEPSLANMYNISKKCVLKCAGYVLLLPLAKCGVFGVIFWIPLLPLVLIMVTLLVFPALSLGSILLWKFLRYIFPEISNETESRLIKKFKIDELLNKTYSSSNKTPNDVSKESIAKDDKVDDTTSVTFKKDELLNKPNSSSNGTPNAESKELIAKDDEVDDTTSATFKKDELLNKPNSSSNGTLNDESKKLIAKDDEVDDTTSVTFKKDELLNKPNSSSNGTPNAESKELIAKDDEVDDTTSATFKKDELLNKPNSSTNGTLNDESEELIAKNNEVDDTTSVCERILRILLVLIAIITVISFVFLMVECIIFLFEVAVYTLIGLVLNSSHAMQYLTGVTLIWFYFFNCFNGISTKYLNYNKAIHKILLSENKDRVVKVAKASSDVQENTAFKVRHASDKDPELVMLSGAPKWSTFGIVLLMDKYDQLYVTKRFFFKASVLDHPHCPGDLFENFMSCLGRFIFILIFLLFVTFVVLAFGDTYDMSISNQLLATCAGGIVPLLIQKSKVIFSKQEEADGDQLQENISFMAKFHSLIEKSKELWNIGNQQFMPELQHEYKINSPRCENDNYSSVEKKTTNNAGSTENIIRVVHANAEVKVEMG